MRIGRISCLLIVSALVWGGCSSKSDALPAATVPARIQDGGETWNHEGGPSADDNKSLERCLANHPSIGDNPDMRGRPEVYTGPKGARRYYWFSTVQGGQRSFYLQFNKNRRFETTGETAELDEP